MDLEGGGVKEVRDNKDRNGHERYGERGDGERARRVPLAGGQVRMHLRVIGCFLGRLNWDYPTFVKMGRVA